MFLEALLTATIIYSYEERDVTTFDLPGSYLHAYITEGKTNLLKLQEHFIDIMCNIRPEHRANVIYERGGGSI